MLQHDIARLEATQLSYDLELKKLEDDLEYAYSLTEKGLNRDDILYLQSKGYLETGLEDAFGTTKTLVGATYGLEAMGKLNGGIIAMLIAALVALVGWLISKIFGSDTKSGGSSGVGSTTPVTPRDLTPEQKALFADLHKAADAGDLDAFSTASGVHLSSAKSSGSALVLNHESILTLLGVAAITVSEGALELLTKSIITGFNAPAALDKAGEALTGDDPMGIGAALGAGKDFKIILDIYKALGFNIPHDEHTFNVFLKDAPKVTAPYLKAHSFTIPDEKVLEGYKAAGYKPTLELNSELQDANGSFSDSKLKSLEGVIGKEIPEQLHTRIAGAITGSLRLNINFAKALISKIVLPYYVSVQAKLLINTTVDTHIFEAKHKQSLRTKFANLDSTSDADKKAVNKWSTITQTIPKVYDTWVCEQPEVAILVEGKFQIEAVLGNYFKNQKKPS